MEKSLDFGDWIIFGRREGKTALVSMRDIGANVILNDLGFMRGYAAFDVASAREEVVFHLHDHLERLRSSVQVLGLNQPEAIESQSVAALENQLKNLLRRNNFESSLLWFYVLAGPSSNGFTPLGESRLLVRVSKFDESSLCRPEGIAVKVVNAKRQMPDIKCMADYAFAEKELAYCRYCRSEYDEILYTEDSEVLELSRRNIFMVKDGTIVTPKDNVLAGVTRGIVINIARELDLPLEEREINIWNPERAEELFATSTASGVTYIRKLDGVREMDDDGQCFEFGPVTQKIQQQFLNYRNKFFQGIQQKQLPILFPP